MLGYNVVKNKKNGERCVIDYLILTKCEDTSSDYFISTLKVEVDLELNEFWIMIDEGIL